ncbi:hypothetical protein DFP72DRAFT_847333 [Ephemerocybe angulata]|uniref:eIF3a PCI domain-containing protein n=1 Tax=Ephemerocybe angulata TaxID=980116 RepID=A0A8H6I034_9AGAR|nr:hypothetical protein DFP72DRAFT_847333 [Tulosesus angulatus]
MSSVLHAPIALPACFICKDGFHPIDLPAKRIICGHCVCPVCADQLILRRGSCPSKCRGNVRIRRRELRTLHISITTTTEDEDEEAALSVILSLLQNRAHLRDLEASKSDQLTHLSKLVSNQLSTIDRYASFYRRAAATRQEAALELSHANRDLRTALVQERNLVADLKAAERKLLIARGETPGPEEEEESITLADPEENSGLGLLQDDGYRKRSREALNDDDELAENARPAQRARVSRDDDELAENSQPTQRARVSRRVAPRPLHRSRNAHCNLSLPGGVDKRQPTGFSSFGFGDMSKQRSRWKQLKYCRSWTLGADSGRVMTLSGLESARRLLELGADNGRMMILPGLESARRLSSSRFVSPPPTPWLRPHRTRAQVAQGPESMRTGYASRRQLTLKARAYYPYPSPGERELDLRPPWTCAQAAQGFETMRTGYASWPAHSQGPPSPLSFSWQTLIGSASALDARTGCAGLRELASSLSWPVESFILLLANANWLCVHPGCAHRLRRVLRECVQATRAVAGSLSSFALPDFDGRRSEVLSPTLSKVGSYFRFRFVLVLTEKQTIPVQRTRPSHSPVSRSSQTLVRPPFRPRSLTRWADVNHFMSSLYSTETEILGEFGAWQVPNANAGRSCAIARLLISDLDAQLYNWKTWNRRKNPPPLLPQARSPRTSLRGGKRASTTSPSGGGGGAGFRGGVGGGGGSVGGGIGGTSTAAAPVASVMVVFAEGSGAPLGLTMARFSKPKTVGPQAGRGPPVTRRDVLKTIPIDPPGIAQPIMRRSIELGVEMRNALRRKEIDAVQEHRPEHHPIPPTRGRQGQRGAGKGGARPESILLGAVSGDKSKDRTDRALVTPWLKFLWENYRTSLETLTNNARLKQIAQQTFKFCLKHQRKVEFPALPSRERRQVLASQALHQPLRPNPPAPSRHPLRPAEHRRRARAVARGLPLCRRCPQPPHHGQEGAPPGDDGQLLRKAHQNLLDERKRSIPRSRGKYYSIFTSIGGKTEEEMSRPGPSPSKYQTSLSSSPRSGRPVSTVLTMMEQPSVAELVRTRLSKVAVSLHTSLQKIEGSSKVAALSAEEQQASSPLLRPSEKEESSRRAQLNRKEEEAEAIRVKEELKRKEIERTKKEIETIRLDEAKKYAQTLVDKGTQNEIYLRSGHIWLPSAPGIIYLSYPRVSRAITQSPQRHYANSSLVPPQYIASLST